jgi:hypothetical protein
MSRANQAGRGIATAEHVRAGVAQRAGVSRAVFQAARQERDHERWVLHHLLSPLHGLAFQLRRHFAGSNPPKFVVNQGQKLVSSVGLSLPLTRRNGHETCPLDGSARCPAGEGHSFGRSRDGLPRPCRFRVSLHPPPKKTGGIWFQIAPV